MQNRMLAFLLKVGLGGCPRCMRISLAWAIAFAVAGAILWGIGLDGPLLAVPLAGTIVFGLLWVGHLTAAAARAIGFADQRSTSIDITRRNAAAAFGAAILMTVVGSRHAAAQNCQCPPGQWAGYNTYLQQCFCCASGQTRCFDEKANWCCAVPGCNC